MWPMSLSIVYVVVPVVFVFIVAVVFVEVCLVNGCYNVYLFKIVCYCICIVVVSLLFLCLLMLLSSFWWCCFCCWYSCLSDIIEHTYSNKRKLVNEVNVQHEPHYECKVFNQWTFCILLANMLQYYNKFVNRAASEAIVNALFSVDTFFVLRLVTSH